MLNKSNLKAVVLASVLLLASISTMSLADWSPGDGHKMHYPQLPDELGWAVYSTAGLDTYGYPQICLADDWLCTESGPVLDIHFWGAWKNGMEGNILSFVIAIAADIPASQNPDGYSKPGETLWEGTFEHWDVLPIDPPSSEGWYDPYSGEVIYDDHVPYFQYNIVDIPEPFYQEVDTIYWLSISAIVAYDPSGLQPLWGWKSSINHWNDDACWAEWGYLNWVDLWEPSPTETDQFGAAFDMAGMPVYMGGTGYNDGMWYEYPSGWWNIWFYDHPLDYDRIKIIETDFLLSQWMQGESWVEIAINWATDLWAGYEDPPLPGCDEELYIGREIIYQGPAPEFQIPMGGIYEILDYNPEWVSMDVMGYNFMIEGIIEHTCLQSLDLAFVITGEEKIPSVDIEKTVWDLTLQEWVEEIDAEVGETVSFQIVVDNIGDFDLTNIFVTDTLPICLEYVGGSADPAPSDIVGNMIIWDFPGPLSHGHTITITFDAEVVSEGENINDVTVTADAADGSIVTAQDTAIVHATEPPVPSVDIEKWVWDETLQEWVDYIEAEICTIERFNLGIHNTGQTSFIVTRIWDILPPCLEYADSATVNGISLEPDVIAPPNIEWNYILPADYWWPGSEPNELPPDEWIYIEFDVHVIGPPDIDNINWGYWEILYLDEYYTFEDDAIIHPIDGEEPWPNHKMHYPQTPKPGGWDVEFAGSRLADDWECSETGPVMDIHFWVSWMQNNWQPIEGFTVTIWSDWPAGAPGNPYEYSVPCDPLWSRDFYASGFTQISQPPDLQGWYDPSSSQHGFDDHVTWDQIDIVDILDPFIQEEGIIYWLEIDFWGLPYIGWKETDQNWNDDAVFWYSPDWMELKDPIEGTSIDLSFVITGHPEDIIPPEIVELSLVSSDPIDVLPGFGWENFSAIVTDVGGVGVDEVKLVVTDPDTITTEDPMTNIPGTDTYYINTTFTIEGCYEYHIWADDFNDNQDTSSSQQFELPPNWDVDMDGKTHLTDLGLIAIHWNEHGSNGWIREDIDNDGKAHLTDLGLVAIHWNEHWDQC